MIAALVLAAGEARRLGQPKQLLPLHKGTMLGHTIAIATGAVDRVVVVLGANANMILTEVHLHGATTVLNPDYQQGQASSLIAGLRALEQMPEIEAAIVMLGDQPTVHPEVFMLLIAARRSTHAHTVVPRYGDVLGNPVLFAREAWPMLASSLSGDRGARRLIMQGEPAPLVEVACPAAWWPPDIDTWDDYYALIEREGQFDSEYGLAPRPSEPYTDPDAPTLRR